MLPIDFLIFFNHTIDPMSAKCKMCENPFTVFKWRPGRGEVVLHLVVQ